MSGAFDCVDSSRGGRAVRQMAPSMAICDRGDVMPYAVSPSLSPSFLPSLPPSPPPPPPPPPPSLPPCSPPPLSFRNSLLLFSRYHRDPHVLVTIRKPEFSQMFDTAVPWLRYDGAQHDLGDALVDSDLAPGPIALAMEACFGAVW